MCFNENDDIEPVVMTKGPRHTGIVNVAAALAAKSGRQPREVDVAEK